MTAPNPKLTLSTLDKVDGGRLAELFDDAMRRVLSDCRDHPGDDKARTVTLTARVKPVLADDERELATVDVDFDVRPVIPKRGTLATRMKIEPDGAVSFSLFDAENPDQGGLDL